ncbi:hypothetical protein D3C83_300750 [compost metagenome]
MHQKVPVGTVMARLSKPPHEKPIPKNLRSFSIAATASRDVGLRTIENRPPPPVKSRFQNS